MAFKSSLGCETSRGSRLLKSCPKTRRSIHAPNPAWLHSRAPAFGGGFLQTKPTVSGSKSCTGDDPCWTEKPLGVGSPVFGVQIGLEELCASNWLNPNVKDRFVHVIAREYPHLQQARALIERQELQRTRGILAEGATEFTSELISGEVAYSYLSALCRRCEAIQPTPRIHLAQCFGHVLGLMPEITIEPIK